VKLTTHILLRSITFILENRVVRDTMWKYFAGHKWQYRTCALHARYLRLQTHTHKVIFIAFPLLKWLQERASLLRYTYIACLVKF